MRHFLSASLTAVSLSASICFSAIPALAQTPSPNASSPPGGTSGLVEDPAVTTLARQQIDSFRAGKIDRTQYTAEVNARITDGIVNQVVQLLARGGAVKAFTYSGKVTQGALQISQYTVTLERPILVPEMPTLLTTDQWIESISTDKDGKINYILFAPKQ